MSDAQPRLSDESASDSVASGVPYSASSDYADPTWGFMARLRRLTQLYTAAWSTRVSSEITSTQFGVLSSLQAIPGQDQGTLGQSLSMDKSSTADVVSRLSKRGYVRVLRDEADSRRKILLLAPEGLEVLEELRPRVTELRKGAFADFDQLGRAQFLADMSRVIETLERAEGAR